MRGGAVIWSSMLHIAVLALVIVGLPWRLERPQRVVPFLFAMTFTPFLSRDAATLLLEGLCVYVAIGAGATALGRMVVIHQMLRRGSRDAGSGHAGPQAPSR